MNKRERSFIEFANNASAKGELIAIEKPVIPRLSDIGKAAAALAGLKEAAIESARQKEDAKKNIEIYKRLVGLLNYISENGQTKDNAELRSFVDIYNAQPKNIFIIEDGNVVKQTLGKLVTIAEYAIIELVEYLSDPNNIKRIKKCPDCLKFFVAIKNNPRQKYCSACSRKNHTPREEQARRTRATRAAAKKRKDKEKRKVLYDDKYKQYIKAGYKENQAKELANQYVIEQLAVIE